MNKKCLGCGIALQNNDEQNLGYTPNIEKDYCMRCFKLKHYGKNIKEDILIDNKSIVDKINQSKVFTLFLTDFLNISWEVIETYKNIKTNKCLVITKKDLFPNNIIIEKFINNIKKTYEIDSKIYFISVKEDLSSFYKEIFDKRKVLLAGYTVAGKSSLINKITGSNILESKTQTTTLDFIEIKHGENIFYDTPGFLYKNKIGEVSFNKKIKPNVKQIKYNEEVKIDKYILNSNVDNNLIFYIPNYLDIIKRKNKTELNLRINVPKNSDLVIKGLGFINVKQSSIIKTNIPAYLIEVRDSLVGALHE